MDNLSKSVAHNNKVQKYKNSGTRMSIGWVVKSFSIFHGYCFCLSLVVTLLSIRIRHLLSFCLVWRPQRTQEPLLHFLYWWSCLVKILTLILWVCTCRLKRFLNRISFHLTSQVIVADSVVMIFTPFHQSVIKLFLWISLLRMVSDVNFLQRVSDWFVKIV